MMSPDFTMADAITSLVAQKRTVGYKYDAEARVLARFEAFCHNEFPGLSVPDQASVEAWLAAARRRAATAATLQTLAAPVRELARWLGRQGVSAYVLPKGALPRPARYVPHIYTDQQLAALFAQTDRCRYCSQVPLRHLVMPVLFRTIYACGLRASEARLLRAGDVDITAGVLQIRDAKGGKDRQVPVSASLRDRLAGYYAHVAGRLGGDWFFPGRAGQPLTLGNVDKNFRRFLWQARIPHGGRGHGPRVESRPGARSWRYHQAFPQAAHRTRRTDYSVTGSPRFLPSGGVRRGPRGWDLVASIRVSRDRDALFDAVVLDPVCRDHPFASGFDEVAA